MDQAETVIRAFIRAERSPRYLALLAKRGGREKLRAQLAHLPDLDLRFAEPIPGSQANPIAVERLLTAKGAPGTCYVLSESAALDGRELPLPQALEQVIGRGIGTLLSCVPGRLAYFEGEDPGRRFILSRAAV
jgi:hypothetical protein